MKSSINGSSATENGACFQKLFMSVLTLGIFITVNAQFHGHNPAVVVHKEIRNSQAFENVEIRGDVTLVLTNEQRSDIQLQGNIMDMDMVTTVEKDNKLEITAKKNASELIVFVPVNKMHSLKINGDAKVFSSGEIVVDDLVITLKGNSTVEVYHHGKLTVIPAEGYEKTDVAAVY